MTATRNQSGIAAALTVLFDAVPDAWLTSFEAAERFFSDQDAIDRAAAIFVKSGWGAWGVEWLARGHQAARENVFTALAHLQAGDGEAAKEAFNKFDDALVIGITANADGTWTMQRRDLPAVRLRLLAIAKPLLAPEEFFAKWQREQQALEDSKGRLQ